MYNVNTGYYSYTTDFCTGIFAIWNFSFSVNLQANTSSTTYDRSNITADLLVHNVGNGSDLSLDVNTIFDNESVDAYTFQNSENLSFFTGVPGWSFDPLANDTYIITLALHDLAGANLGSVQEVVIAGTGELPSSRSASLCDRHRWIGSSRLAQEKEVSGRCVN